MKSLLYRYGLYDRVSNKTIWILGLMGLAIRFYLMGTHVQIGDVIGKTLAGFLFFQYAPLILFFPSLYSNSQKQNDIVADTCFQPWLCRLYGEKSGGRTGRTCKK